MVKKGRIDGTYEEVDEFIEVRCPMCGFANRIFRNHFNNGSPSLCGGCGSEASYCMAGPPGGIGDLNSNEKGTGARFNAGKPDLSLIPLSTLEGEARVWMYGEKKYARFNWQKGLPWSSVLACMLRHLAAWQRGEETDAESGESHLSHAACNLRMLIWFAENYKEGDDRLPKEMKK